MTHVSIPVALLVAAVAAFSAVSLLVDHCALIAMFDSCVLDLMNAAHLEHDQIGTPTLKAEG